MFTNNSFQCRLPKIEYFHRIRKMIYFYDGVDGTTRYCKALSTSVFIKQNLTGKVKRARGVPVLLRPKAKLQIRRSHRRNYTDETK